MSTYHYLDAAAGAPLRPEVLEAMLPLLQGQAGNPSALHRAGRAARRAVEEARGQVAELLGAAPREIVFTSGATEANNLVLRSVAGRETGAARIAVSAVEHPSVLGTARCLEKMREAMLDILPVDPQGRVALHSVSDALARRPALLCLMLGNNETGVLQPVEETAAACADAGIPLHVDAVQAVGNLPVDVRRLRVAFMSVSAHKLGGPQGVGALYVRHGHPLCAEITGGAQEHGRRAGTENFAGIAGFGVACALALRTREAACARLARVRDGLEAALLQVAPDARVIGAGAPRLPHILNLCFPGQDGERLMLALDSRGVAVSTGAACRSGAAGPSHVLLAMGMPAAEAQTCLRFSLGWHSQATEIDAVARALAESLEVLNGREQLA